MERMKDTESSKSFTERGMPTHQQLVVPILVAVAGLGGSARVQEIVDEVLELLPNSEALLEMKYQEDARQPVLINQIAWGAVNREANWSLGTARPGSVSTHRNWREYSQTS